VQIDDISKVESYFGRVQQANTQFTDKLLSYFDNVIDSAHNTPRHLVMALRVVLNQEVVWTKLQQSVEANPWGVVYREAATDRLRQGIAKQLKPICHEAERVRYLASLHDSGKMHLPCAVTLVRSHHVDVGFYWTSPCCAG
jgi:hypothetical protein